MTIGHWSKVEKAKKGNVELSDYTADRPDNCQFVFFADSMSGKKCCFYQLSSHQVYLYSTAKRKEACCLHVALHRSYQLPSIWRSWEINPQPSWGKLQRESAVICIHWQYDSMLTLYIWSRIKNSSTDVIYCIFVELHQWNSSQLQQDHLKNAD